MVTATIGNCCSILSQRLWNDTLSHTGGEQGAMHRMSASTCQSKRREFIERAPSSAALLPALIGALNRWAVK